MVLLVPRLNFLIIDTKNLFLAISNDIKTKVAILKMDAWRFTSIENENNLLMMFACYGFTLKYNYLMGKWLACS